MLGKGGSVATHRLRPGQQIDGYEVVELIGAGTVAEVYAIAVPGTGTRLALKLMRVMLPAFVKRFEIEAHAQSRIRHPNVARVYGSLQVGQTLGIVMELVPGPTLREVLFSRRLALTEALELFRGVLGGVQAAHDEGVVHRDIKPDNVLLTGDGRVPKLADFGLARDMTVDQRTTISGAHMGAGPYVSPEQVRESRAVDARSDMFSLGSLLYEMVTGERAFQALSSFELMSAIASARYPPPLLLEPELPEEVVRTIGALLRVEPDDRLQSPSEAEAMLFG